MSPNKFGREPFERTVRRYLDGSLKFAKYIRRMVSDSTQRLKPALRNAYWQLSDKGVTQQDFDDSYREYADSVTSLFRRLNALEQGINQDGGNRRKARETVPKQYRLGSSLIEALEYSVNEVHSNAGIDVGAIASANDAPGFNYKLFRMAQKQRGKELDAEVGGYLHGNLDDLLTRPDGQKGLKDKIHDYMGEIEEQIRLKDSFLKKRFFGFRNDWAASLESLSAAKTEIDALASEVDALEQRRVPFQTKDVTAECGALYVKNYKFIEQYRAACQLYYESGLKGIEINVGGKRGLGPDILTNGKNPFLETLKFAYDCGAREARFIAKNSNPAISALYVSEKGHDNTGKIHDFRERFLVRYLTEAARRIVIGEYDTAERGHVIDPESAVRVLIDNVGLAESIQGYVEVSSKNFGGLGDYSTNDLVALLFNPGDVIYNPISGKGSRDKRQFTDIEIALSAMALDAFLKQAEYGRLRGDQDKSEYGFLREWQGILNECFGVNYELDEKGQPKPIDGWKEGDQYFQVLAGRGRKLNMVSEAVPQMGHLLAPQVRMWIQNELAETISPTLVYLGGYIKNPKNIHG
ncbi:MAG: hypothetical protein KKC75_03475 [Nanoarchaeota archaeon]|nr:hypothetical protein [Nanoarchaeota archaeon]MBU1945352.1 hypothetical protein [Nanoarchaeota archaeon]